MTRAPAPRRAASAPPAVTEPHCPRNDDCDRDRARATAQLAAVAEAFLLEFHELKPTLHAVGEIAGKWLRFCAFLRKWFPRLWVFLPLIAGALFKGSSEATDALIQAVTLFLQSQTGA